MSLRTALVLAILCAAGASSAAGQERVRSGPWVSLGIGGGWTRVNCSICRVDRNAGPAATLGFGTTVRDGLLVGAELDGWTRSVEGSRTLLIAGNLAAYVYPDPARGLFLKAGAGMVRYGFDSGDGSANLIGLLLGAGYEIPISPALSITNSIGLVTSSFGALRSDEGVVADDVSISMLQFGIAITHR